MAQRKSKCVICGVSDKREKVIEKNKRYHIGECYEKYLQQQAFKEEERRQKDELTKTILQIHGLKNSQEIPKLFWMKLEEVRNDSGTLGKVNKKYKQGVRYSALDYTYKFVQDKIEYVLKTKEFSSKLNEMLYCFAIVQNSIVDAYHDALQKMMNAKKQEEIKKQTTTVDMSLDMRSKPVKNKKDDLDISHLL